MSTSFITINEKTIPWEQVIGHLQLFGKLKPFLQEFVSQYVLVEEVNSRDDLEVNSADVMQAMMDFRLQQKLTDADAFKNWLQRENLNNQTFQNRIALGLKIEKLKEAIAAPQLETYFEEHKGTLEEVSLHCVITPEKDLSKKVKQQLAEGTNIKDLAQKYASSEQNIRFFKQQLQRRSLTKTIQNGLKSASTGTLIGPFEMNKSWSVFRVIEIIPAQLDQKTKKQIEAQLFGEWLVQKLQDSKIEFKDVVQNRVEL